MRFPILVTLTLLVAAGARAQTKTITSPTGFLTTECATGGAPTSATYFGGYAAYETQIFDGHHRGGGLKFLQQIDCRLDHRDHTTTPLVARTWTNVSLSMSDCIYDGPIFPVLAANALSTPTMVFSSSVSWPAVTGYPHGNVAPNPWGVEVSFPFTTSWVTTGQQDILQHWIFAGGQLAAGAWGGTTRSDYHLDAHHNTTAANGYYYYYNTVTPCVDSYQTAFAYAYAYATTYAVNAFDPTYNNKITIDTRSNRTAPSRPVIQAYSLVRANLVFPPVPCQTLSVDTNQSLFVTGVADFTGYFGITRFTAPWNPVFVNQQLYTQSAWDDSATKRLMLSRPAYTIFMNQPEGRFRCVYVIGTAAPVLSDSPSVLPVVRYTHT